ncbi:hypothetical protein TWF481_001553 [Arthrobotrys musiformis]|uniref:Uncharacterized protein n=1 Tax=Arthrobotrys musiformis TaxID=47236 RepID=A0AAV9VWE8_9PEZI
MEASRPASARAHTAASISPSFPSPKYLRRPPNPPPTGPLPRPPSPLELRKRAQVLSEPASAQNNSSAGQLSPSSSPSTNAADKPLPFDRKLSAHTQASSDALGENYLPARLSTLPPLDQDQSSRKPSPISTDRSKYSDFSLLVSKEETHPPGLTHISRFDPGAVSLGELQRDSNVSGRPPRLSYVSGSAAFEASVGNEDFQTDIIRPRRTHSSLLGLGGQRNTHPGVSSPYDISDLHNFYINSTLGNPGDPRLRIHPADNRFEHTYRIRKANETEEPIYVPVYNFAPPGKFPDRSRLTAPLATPKFLNYTPRKFLLPERSDGNPAARSSSDSAEMLLGNSVNTFDGPSHVIRVPPQAHDARGRNPHFFWNPLSRKSPIVAFRPPGIDKIKSSRSIPDRETAHQRFEREHSHYFHDLNYLEESHWPAALVPAQIQIHGPKYSFSKYGVPTLSRPEDSYTGKEINEDCWPERYKRQKRIGRSMLCIFIAMPPLWLVMAVGLLDNLVSEMTSGEIWGVGRPEKVFAAWFGGISCLALIVAIILIGVIVLSG